MKKNILLIASIFCAYAFTFGQDVQCPSIVNLAEMQTQDPARYQRFMDLENFIANQSNGPQRLINPNGIITIPVVVHVLHRGEAIGSGRNISDAQIQSQIDVLNEDFRRLNADKVNTPAVFAPVAADFGFEFKLACQDPAANPTNGIVRKYTNNSSFTFSSTNNVPNEDAMGIKKSSQSGDDPWPTDRYLNIWVVDFSGSILGYSTFPADYSTRSQFDGVVIKNTAFGRVGNISSPYNKGRTASHEVGHWLDLRHIWGDAACGNDFVADTPPQAGPNSNCPAFPHPSGCVGNGPNGDMFMNYMDYPDDACLNIFTNGQRFRGKSIFNTGGPRAAFLDNYFRIIPSTIYCSGAVKLFNPLCLPVTWSILSGSATITSSDNSQANISSSTAGSVTLRATGGNYITEQTINVSLDKPLNTQISYTVDGVEYPVRVVAFDIPDEICLYKQAYPTITFAYANNVLWEKTSSPSVAYDNYNHSFYFANTGQFLNLKVSGTNACGTTIVYGNFRGKTCVAPGGDPCGSYRISPNPSTGGKLDIEPNIAPPCGYKNQRNIKEVRIYNSLKELKKVIKAKDVSRLSIDISFLPKGTYHVYITDGVYTQTKNIFVL